MSEQPTDQELIEIEQSEETEQFLIPIEERSSFIVRMCDHKFLTYDQQLEYGKRAFYGDINARNELISHNYRLAFSMALRYYKSGTGVELDDLFSEGIRGLITAAEKYDYRKKFHFTTYATWWIRQSITRYLHNETRCIRLPVHISEKIAIINKSQNKLGPNATFNEIAADINDPKNFSPKQIEKLLKYKYETQVSSIDAPVSAESRTPITIENLTDCGERTDTSLHNTEVHETLTKLLSILPEKNRQVLLMRNGLYGDNRYWTLEEVGSKLHVTRERVRQIERDSMNRLSKNPANKRLIAEVMGFTIS